MHYFLLSHKNKSFVSPHKNVLIQKANDIVSQQMFNYITQTGSSFSYEKVINEEEDETSFFIVSKNCNSLYSFEQEEKICSISSTELIEFISNENPVCTSCDNTIEEKNCENSFEHIDRVSQKKDE
jgi:hypothetical protein